MLSETEQLSDLIAAIYDTAFDPSRWPDALERTALFMNATGATFVAHDAARKEGNPVYTVGGDAALNERYFSDTVKFNPALGADQPLSRARRGLSPDRARADRGSPPLAPVQGLDGAE